MKNMLFTFIVWIVSVWSFSIAMAQEANKNFRVQNQGGGRSVASRPGTTSASTALEIKGEAKNLDMVLRIDDSEEVDFIQLRENYDDEVDKLYSEPNF